MRKTRKILQRNSNDRGVTLVALVVTIAILIILSSVTISAVMGENGLVSQAKLAKDLTANSTYAEAQQMNDLLAEYANVMAEDSSSEITPPDTNEITPEPPVDEGIDASEIAESPTEYYGGEVTGYECESDGVSQWRIFYADTNNIYLIADDYIEYTKAPKATGGGSIYGYNYTANLSGILNYYSGATDIENSKGKAWLTRYLEAYNTSTNDNVKETAYLMDTNAWSIYAGEDAEYAMGGPTIELYSASYKGTHPDKYIECGIVNLTGYQLRWNGESYGPVLSGVPRDEFNGIYIKSSTAKARGMWIASPSSYYNSITMYVTYGGNINSSTPDADTAGLRPIVCLKTGIHLEKQSDGKFMIVK